MKPDISAIILAAGSSRRMGQPKMLLPWGETTILGQVVAEFASAGITNMVVVTGGSGELIEAEVTRLANKFAVRPVFNASYESGEMLSSIQAGLAAQKPEVAATIIGLGDQPQIRARTIRNILRAFEPPEAKVIIPSFEKRRGHPILLPRQWWNELLLLKPPGSLRDFINIHANEILYIDGDANIFQDIDTPEEYRQARPT
jgi:molybdenum cofactor cytidylyltransferase